MSYLNLKVNGIAESIYVKVQRETDHYYYINKYPTLGINPTFNLKCKNDPNLVRISKTNIKWRDNLTLLRHVDVPPPVNDYRIYQ